MRITFSVVAILALSLALFMPPPAVGFESLLGAARAAYPDITGTALDDCVLCHTPSFGLNSYGAEYNSNGQDFGAIEGKDSDDDGFTNIVEIMALTFPGDASSFPSGGGVAPGAPTSLAANVNGTSATLTWAAPTTGDAPTSYLLMVGTSAGASDVLNTELNGTTHTLNDLAAGTYHAQVSAKNDTGTGPASDSTSFTIEGGGGGVAPGAPADLAANVNGTSATLTWSAPTTGDAPTSYLLMVGSSAGASDVLNTEKNGTTHTLNSLAAGTYHAQVSAKNDTGTGPASDSKSFTIEDGGGGGGDDRVVARGNLGAQVGVTSVDIATPFKNNLAPLAYTESAVTREPGRFASARLDGTVSIMRTDPDGDSSGPRAVGSDVDAEGNVAVTGHKKGDAVSWRGAEGATIAQWTKKGKLKKSSFELADTSGNSAAIWIPGTRGKTYYIGSAGTGDGAQLDEVKKNKVLKRIPAQRTTIPEIDSILAFAAGGPTTGRVLLGGETGEDGTRLLGMRLVKGDVTAISDPLTDFIADLEAVGAFGDTDAGIAVYRDGTKVFTAGLNADGTLAGAWARLSGATAGAIAVAPQSDGTFLVVWVDASGSVMAADVDPVAETTSDAFELQADTEVAEPGLVSAARVGDTVIVLYATSDGLRTAVVGPAS